MRRPRRGITLLELMVVMAALVILGGVFLPTLSGMRGNTRVKAAVDTVRGRIAEARMRAIENGQAYRLALSPDGKRLRLAPDAAETTGQSDGTAPAVEEDLPEQVTAELMVDDDGFAGQDTNGWTRVATFQPDGTCREDTVHVLLKELGVSAMFVRLRGLTGTTCSGQASALGGK
jgi:Tfp pilus assembly protein FimT